MFLNINPGTPRKRSVLKELPHAPDNGWRAPTYFPELRGASLLAFDVETKENDFEHGPGWARGASHIVGLSMAALFPDQSVWKGYFPIRHEVETHDNMPAPNVIAWAKDMLETPIPKTGANLIYDVGCLGDEGIKPGGPLYDTQFAEALLDESSPTNLEHLANKYLNESKTSADLYYWLSKAYGGNPTPKQRSNIYRAPPRLVGFYAESDAVLPLSILPLQWTELAGQGLVPLFEMECRLIRLMIKMRQNGVQINVNYAEQLYAELGGDLKRLHDAFAHKYGARANYNSADELAPIFDSLGIKYPRTEGGRPSLRKDWLHNLDHQLGKDINGLRELEKLRNTFLKSYLIERHTNGLVHCSFHPLRVTKDSGADTNGAKTGRLASSDPNLQNIPTRTDTGKRIRRAFVPRYRRWRKYDYSQIEYRFLAHFATDNGDGSADVLRNNYINDPNCDYHDIVYYRACPYMGWDANDPALKKANRKPIKNTNFGLLYGQGQGKLARTMGFTPQQAKDFFTAYHDAAPYVKPTMLACAQEVHANGFVTTILGRRTRFDLWLPFNWHDNDDDSVIPLRFDHAISRYGSNIERAYAYRAVNYKFQGSAADKMKVALDKCEQSGVFDYTGVPLLTVHDELDFDEIDDTPAMNEAYRFIQHTMETAIALRVPVKADPEVGPNWGDLTELAA